jgi:hypothetical protein
MEFTIKSDGVTINKSFTTIDEALTFGKALKQPFGIHEVSNGLTSPVPSIHYSPDINESSSHILFG